MSDEISPDIQAAVSTVWTKYMLMISLYGKAEVIKHVEALECTSLEMEKIRNVLLPKLRKVNLK